MVLDIERSEDMLTPNQEAFAQNIIEGMTQADAYRSAYDCSKMSDKTIWEKASRLMADNKVRTRVQELRDQVALSSIMTAQERLKWLTSVIKDAEERTENKLKAADIMNKMQGEYVQRIEADVNSEVNINIELSDDE